MSPNGEISLLFCLFLSSSTILSGNVWWLSQQIDLRLISWVHRSEAPTLQQLEPITIQQFAAPPPSPLVTTKMVPSPHPLPLPSTKPSVLLKPIPSITAVKGSSKPKKSVLKAIRAVYLSRYQITNNASEKMIRERVRYYHSQGVNTLIHGVWGNGCTMYNSQEMQKRLDLEKCPNQFQEKWLDWLIDEAHSLGMEIHAYFEKGIKLDKNSPLFERALANQWFVPGIDKTYQGIDHYVLDVSRPEVSGMFIAVIKEFVQKYPTIDAVQWDDYLGYHSELASSPQRTQQLTQFVNTMIKAMKQANPNVKFDLCHHNPYWAKRYFAADWENWQVDRVFIQAYNDTNFTTELAYAKKYHGISLTDQQLHRLKGVITLSEISHIFLFALSGKPEKAAENFNVLPVTKP